MEEGNTKTRSHDFCVADSFLNVHALVSLVCTFPHSDCLGPPFPSIYIATKHETRTLSPWPPSVTHSETHLCLCTHAGACADTQTQSSSIQVFRLSCCTSGTSSPDRCLCRLATTTRHSFSRFSWCLIHFNCALYPLLLHFLISSSQHHRGRTHQIVLKPLNLTKTSTSSLHTRLRAGLPYLHRQLVSSLSTRLFSTRSLSSYLPLLSSFLSTHVRNTACVTSGFFYRFPHLFPLCHNVKRPVLVLVAQTWDCVLSYIYMQDSVNNRSYQPFGLGL